MTTPNLSRRRFIRVLGGSAIVLGAGAFGLSRCDQLPPELLESWNGPPASETDPRRRALAFALLAPNPHNRQSWLADLRVDGEITLWTDRTRLLPMTDPFSRQIMVGCGCFLETLMLALNSEGPGASLDLFPEGGAEDAEVGYAPFARITLGGSPPNADPLFGAILKRRSAKVDYDPARIPDAAAVAAISAAATRDGVRFAATNDTAQLATLKSIAKEAFRIEVDTDRTYQESVDLMRIGADDIARHRDGLTMHGPFFWWMKKLGFMSPEAQMEKGGIARDQARSFIDSQVDTTPLFAWIISAANDRRAQVESGRAYMRANLQATASGVAMAPLSQALQEFPEMGSLYRAIHEACGAAPGETMQMFFRLGYADAPEPVVRRRLDDIIRT